MGSGLRGRFCGRHCLFLSLHYLLPRLVLRRISRRASMPVFLRREADELRRVSPDNGGPWRGCPAPGFGECIISTSRYADGIRRAHASQTRVEGGLSSQAAHAFQAVFSPPRPLELHIAPVPDLTYEPSLDGDFGDDLFDS